MNVAVGVGRDFDRTRIEATPSVSRDFVNTLATDPKILVDNSVARGPAVSIGGANFRYNNLTIDGVAQNDNFGLSKNASSTQRTPISIDAIEAVRLEWNEPRRLASTTSGAWILWPISCSTGSDFGC